MRSWLGDEVFRDLIGGGDFEATSGSDNLMFCPGVFEVVQTSPERGYPPFNLFCHGKAISRY